MFSSEFQKFARQAWDATHGPLPCLDGLTPEETVLCQLAYGTLPASDTASVPLDVMLGYVRHALMLRQESPFCRDLPEDLFLHFVFYPRVNSENVEDCRRFFYDRIMPRLAGMDAAEAILEVNRWCGEQVTYQSSNDRTEGPLTAYFSGIGRCGEESTFAVTALRSVGIPARQIYVPYWAHCDDNHAWVEVYANGRWNFFGACEPEPILNRGWFADASSRAPLACYRRFFDFTGESMGAEQRVDQQGSCLLYNVIDHYAPASDLTIRVLDGAGVPVPDVRVELSVVNMAAFSGIASLMTDDTGSCMVHMGHVSVHVEAWTADQFACADLTVAEDAEITLTLDVLNPSVPVMEFDCTAPAATPVNRTVLTPEQQSENNAVLARCTAIRTERIGSYYLPEYDELDADWQQILHLAAGNAAELYRLWRFASEEERPLYKAMLHSMEAKDYRDTSAELLRTHLAQTMPFRDKPHFVEEILCPRLHLEMLECWRGPITAAFTKEQKTAFARDPEKLMQYIRDNYPDGDLRYYSTLSIQPTAVLKLGHADERGRRLLFVAVLRTLGVPARINTADGGAEYFRDGAYHSVTAGASTASALLRLIPQTGKRFVYASNYSLSRLEGRGYLPLDYLNTADPFTMKLTPGDYRLLTTNRLPNGSQQCILTHFSIHENETLELPLELREPAPEEMLSSGMVEHFQVSTAEGEAVPSEVLLTGKTILVYLDVSKEPTEHILNEVIAAADELRERMGKNLRLCYVLRSPAECGDPTLQKALAAVPETEIFYDSFTSDTTMLARKLFLEPGVWPLLLLTDGTHRGYYGTCGYQVGTVELTLKLADVIK